MDPLASLLLYHFARAMRTLYRRTKYDIKPTSLVVHCALLWKLQLRRLSFSSRTTWRRPTVPTSLWARQHFRRSRQPGVLSHRVEPLSIQLTHLNKNSNAPSFGYGNFRTRSKAYSIALEPFLAVHRELMMSATFTFAPAARCGIAVKIAQGPSPATGLIPSYVDRATTARTWRSLCQTSQALQQLHRPQDVDGAWPLLLFSSRTLPRVMFGPQTLHT